MKKILVIMMALLMVLLTACASQPAAEPTAAPTEAATEAPTEAPTEEPTAEPTEEPTAEPTEEPTAEPTEEPTEEPTAEPTEEPAAVVEETTEAVETAAEETTEAVETAAEETTEVVETAEAPAVMTYEEYAAAELKSTVTVETYVQNKQGWWNNQLTVYTQDENGGYFLYNMPCTEEQAAQLVPGTKIRVTGTKDAWEGEVEIIDITSMEIVEADPFVAEPLDVTALLGTDELIEKQNMLVAFKGMTIEASQDVDGNDVAFLYNWDGSGMEGSDSDLYFKASVNGQTYTFVIEYYLTGADTDAYQAVQSLQIGDKVDLEGFLYWYQGSQPHITSVVAAAE